MVPKFFCFNDSDPFHFPTSILKRSVNVWCALNLHLENCNPSKKVSDPYERFTRQPRNTNQKISFGCCCVSWSKFAGSILKRPENFNYTSEEYFCGTRTNKTEWAKMNYLIFHTHTHTQITRLDQIHDLFTTIIKVNRIPYWKIIQ